MSEAKRTEQRGCFPTFAAVLRWRLWRTAAKALLVLLILGGIAHIAGNVYFGGKVRAELRRLKAAGKPVTGADLAPPPVSASENALPLYLEAAAIIGDGAASAYPEPPKGYVVEDWTDAETLAELSAALERDKAALRLVREATMRPHFRSDLDWSDPLHIDLTYLSQCRSLAYFLAGAAGAAAMGGHQAEALERLRMGYVLARHATHEPTLINVMHACAIDFIMLNATEYVLCAGALPEREAKALAEELGRVDYAPAFRTALDAERVWALHLFELARRNRFYEAVFGQGEYDRVGFGTRLYWWGYAYPLRPLTYADELQYLRVADAAVELYGMSATERTRRHPGHPTEDLVYSAPRWAIVTRTVIPGFWNARTKVDVAQSRRRLAQAVIGLELYHQRRGVYPESLAQLRAGGWTVPADLYAERDVIYRRQERGFLLYSVGPDGDDDGGDPIAVLIRDSAKRRERQRQRRDWYDGDVPWSRPSG